MLENVYVENPAHTNALSPGIWGRDVTPESLTWDVPEADPFMEIYRLGVDIEKRTARRPDVFIVALDLFQVLARNATVAEHYRGLGSNAPLGQMVSAALGVDLVLVSDVVRLKTKAYAGLSVSATPPGQSAACFEYVHSGCFLLASSAAWPDTPPPHYGPLYPDMGIYGSGYLS